MLCVAKVNLSDWPEGQRRDVDPTNERTVGLLRAGYIVPLQLPRRLADQPTQGSLEAGRRIEKLVRQAPRKRANRPRAGDE